MANQAQRREARERGEARFAQLARRDEEILTQERAAREAADAKYQRLRALRLSKKAGEQANAKPGKKPRT